MFNSKGIIHYDDSDGLRLTLKVGQDLSNCYLSLIPRYFKVCRPRYAAHITVVRPEYEAPPKIRYWGDYEGERVEFMYDPHLLNGRGYYWLNVWSKRLEFIRTELGLVNTSKYCLKPVGYEKTFHITVGKYEESFEGVEPEK